MVGAAASSPDTVPLKVSTWAPVALASVVPSVTTVELVDAPSKSAGRLHDSARPSAEHAQSVPSFLANVHPDGSVVLIVTVRAGSAKPEPSTPASISTVPPFSTVPWALAT